MAKCVLLPYEITLFSNEYAKRYGYSIVLLPYEITLFSNVSLQQPNTLKVLLPYEITLFSNTVVNTAKKNKFYYLMKLHYSQTD